MAKPPGGALLNNITIERNSSVPIYRQLDASFRRLILDGTLSPGQKLPSTRELMEDLGVSRITVKQVYEQLIAEGFARARTGSGTYVAEGLEIELSPKIKRSRRKPQTPNLKLSKRSREIATSKASIRQGKIDPFRPGVPALDLFPEKLWNKYQSNAMSADGGRNLSYGHVCGSPALRSSIARHLSDARGMQVDPDQIVITSGGQQAFVLISYIMLNQGDTVWYEEPGHIAGRDVMKMMGANVTAVPIDSDGIDIDFAQSKFPKPRLVFTTPSHQQPLGTTMSLGRRLSLLNYVSENDAWVIEDDYDSEFRYRGRPLPALSAMDSERRVFYVGTFSKSMYSAIRLGYVVVPPELVNTFAQARNLLGQNSSPVTEQAMSLFMDDGRFVEHIRKMRRVYRIRRNVMFESLQAECNGLLEPQPTDAGMHMVAWLKNGLNDDVAHSALLNTGIESLPLSVYLNEISERNALILGFSGVPEDRIPGLVKQLSNVLNSL